jgi:isopentenyl diphosphate isomerase/L-lactate dehydrogenase-like FMN-dependent dehydrogenase
MAQAVRRTPVRILSFADARTKAKRRLPKAMFDSIECGAGQELTLRGNLDAFLDVGFRPQAAVQYPTYDLSTTVIGHQLSTPIMIAPTGSIRMFRGEGEPAVARVAGEAGTIHIVSCFTGYSIEDIAAQSKGPIFFDLYLAGGRSNVEVMLDRARKAGCQALVITADMAGMHAVERLGGPTAEGPIGVNLATALRYASQLVTKPAWTCDFVRDGMHLDCPMWIKPDGKPASFGEMTETIMRESPTWNDLPWIREHWDRPIIVKGILRPEDARKAVDAGVDAIVVSNHGGRNVDGSPATLSVLPAIVDAVDGRLEVYVDGGIRRGTDVIKALALGARAVLIGRAYIYPFAAAGSEGVRQMLDVLGSGMVATLRSLGCASVRTLNRSYVTFPESRWKELAYGSCRAAAGVGDER